MGEASITYSLKYQARCLCAYTADKSTSSWLVGTNSLREENEIRVLQYDPGQETLRSVQSYVHSPEVWDIAPCPATTALLLTVWSKAGQYGCSLYEIGDDAELHRRIELEGHEGVVRRVLWHTRFTDTVLTLEEGALRTWDLGDNTAECVGQASPGELQQLWSGALDPRTPHMAATASGNNVQLWDLRTMTKVGEVVAAHRMPTRDVDFAPVSEYHLASAGDDCKIRFWDIRVMGRAESLLELGGHSHWVWRAQYNPQHEALLASSSSDSLVNLWYTPEVAAMGDPSVQPGSAGEVRAASPAPQTPTRGESDGKVHTYDEHEDSVYGLAWSSVDPWLFASLSYDGRVVINKVPKNVKYKILL